MSRYLESGIDHSGTIIARTRQFEYPSRLHQIRWRPGRRHRPGRVRLEAEPKTELDDARKVVLCSDLAKGAPLRHRRTAARVRRIKLRGVEEIEELGTKLEAESRVEGRT